MIYSFELKEQQILIDAGDQVDRLLAQNICTDAQFFIDTLIKNIYGFPIDMASYFIAEIIDEYQI